MADEDEVLAAIKKYIIENFPDATIEQWEDVKQDSLNFRIIENDKTYTLRVMQECYLEDSLQDMHTMLENYNVAQVLRDIIDFPIVVTNSGCIFGSP